MRVAAPSLALSLLLCAAPAFAQGGGDYYNYNAGNPYDRQMNQDRYNRYEYYPPQGETWHGPRHYGPWEQGGMQEMMRRHQRMMQGMQGMQGGYQPQMGSSQMPMGAPQTGPANTNAVSSATQSQIKSSLEASGFKNVTVVPQGFLIRATAPDGSRVVMQVTPDSLSGVVINTAQQGGAGGTGAGSSSTSGTGGTSGTGSTSSTGTGGTSSTGTGSTSSTGTGGTSGTGGPSSAGSSSTGGTGSANSSGTGSASSSTTPSTTGH